METKSLFDELQRIAQAFGFGYGWTSEGGLHFAFGCEHSRFPIHITAEHKQEDEFFVYGYVRTFGLAGCRTDLHDWIGSLWAICCRGLETSSVWIVDEGGFGLDEEIYARIIVFSQPDQGNYRINAEADRQELERIFAASNLFALILAKLWRACGITDNDEFIYGDDALPADLMTAFSANIKDTAIYGRRSACINYYRDSQNDISITDFRECSEWRSICEHMSKWDVLRSETSCTRGESTSALLIRSGKIRNVVSKRMLARLRKMLGRLVRTSPVEICVFPCDSHLIAISEHGICSKRVESGARFYARAFQELYAQHRRNAAFLNQDIQFEWATNPNAVRFEDFILDLLNGNPGVRRAHARGHANEPDAKSDLTAEVYVSFLRNERTLHKKREPQNDTVRLVVQCKTSIRNVGKAKVTDIHDTVDRHSAAGFLLVALPGVTNELAEYIRTIRSKDLFWIECWTKPDLEAELRANPSIVTKYHDLVTLTPPPTEQA